MLIILNILGLCLQKARFDPVLKTGNETSGDFRKDRMHPLSRIWYENQMIETNFVGVGIDTPEDLEKARRLI
jgi:hypothetical protein